MPRVVFLVDMNAFFISCETTRNPALLGKPAAVAGDPKRRSGIILAANYEARRFGIKTTMVLHKALELCPSLILVPPDHSFYEKKSHEVMTLLGEFTPVIEQGSIDEAWLDMTGTENLFGSPFSAAAMMMGRIRDELGLWCSIGISDNKFLAKMASEFKKPLGITELYSSDVPEKLWPLSVKAIYGVGKQTADKLEKLNIRTIGELASQNEELLLKHFGKYGHELYLRAHGIDEAPVTPHVPDEMKSIGRSTTLPNDITDLEEAKKVIIQLAEEIGQTARASNKKGRTVQITIKYSDFQSITRQTGISPTYLSRDIIGAGLELLRKNWNSHRPVRLLGISITGFEDGENNQISLFDVLTEEPEPNQKEERLEKAVDSLREKYGMYKISRGSLLKPKEPDKETE
ncbi:MAG: DNA polymerase IV [Clostridia bacterium]|nr:DNA polymerase IV [Clostridia bacterium]